MGWGGGGESRCVCRVILLPYIWNSSATTSAALAGRRGRRGWAAGVWGAICTRLCTLPIVVGGGGGGGVEYHIIARI